MPERHSIPASPSATQPATSSSHGSPAAAVTLTTSPSRSRAIPRIAIRSRIPLQPLSATTTFEPPAMTANGRSWRWAHRIASVAVSTSSTSMKYRAVPPSLRFVSGASETPNPNPDGVRSVFGGFSRDITTSVPESSQFTKSMECPIGEHMKYICFRSKNNHSRGII